MSREAPPPLPATVVCHHGDGALRRALPAWESLLAVRRGAPVFQRPLWAGAWLSVYGRRRQVHLVEVRRRERALGLIPLQLTTVAGLGLRRLEFIGGGPATRTEWLLDPDGLGLAYHNDALILPGEGRAVVGALREWLKHGCAHWDDLRLTAVPAESPLAADFEAVLARDWSPHRREQRLRRAVDIAAGWESAVAAMGERQRRHLRYEPSALARAAGSPLHLEEVRGAGAPAAMERFLQLHARRWAAERRPGLSAGDSQLYRSLAARGGDNVVVFELTAGGRLLASQFGFDYGGVYMPYNVTHDPDLRRCSPANVLLQEVIRCCCERGHREVDLAGLRHAERWARAERLQVHLYARRHEPPARLRAAVYSAAGDVVLRVQGTACGRRLRTAAAAASQAGRGVRRRVRR